ncbi:low molecular weight phosphatase family protein [Mycobacterium sp. WMMD1722]|uniref:arsenate reductase/protein-tyrosine-phosphatase family protein n=1 Tax=Mycobacterium sp. WMMD1722 TaxID=3404117 RepID=UPI003BF46898
MLFVCTGNICRSPIAERLAAALARRHDIADLVTSSAGTRAVIGHAMHPEASRVLAGLGGDSTDFVARQLTSTVASRAHLILTMTKAHRDTVLGHAPRQLSRTFTLAEAAFLASEAGAREVDDLAELRPRLSKQPHSDILDPIGGSPELFEAVGNRIATLLPPILRLCQSG